MGGSFVIQYWLVAYISRWLYVYLFQTFYTLYLLNDLN